MTPDELVGIFCLVGGAILCIFGLKYRECTLSFFGSGLGAYLFYIIGTKIQFGFATQIVLSVLVSLLFSFICMKLTRVSVFLIAIIHATCISNLMAPGLGSYWGSFVFYGCIIILPSLFLYAPDVGILVSSAFFGAWIFVTGIELLINTGTSGFPNPLVVLFHKNWDTLVTLEESAFLECLLVCSVMITSLVIQIRSMTTLKEKVLDELISAIHDKVLKKLEDYKPSEIVGENEAQLREILIDIEVIEKVNAIINGKDLDTVKKEVIEDGDMVTPGGEDDSCTSNNDKKAYFFEKLVGKTEDAKPLLN